jgi:hypothetical protein
MLYYIAAAVAAAGVAKLVHSHLTAGQADDGVTELKVGSNLKDFAAASKEIGTHDGNKIILSAFIGKQPLVLFFYPKAETPGCTKQVRI